MIEETFPEVTQALLSGYTSNGANYRTGSSADVLLFRHAENPGLHLKHLDVNRAEKEATLDAEYGTQILFLLF